LLAKGPTCRRPLRRFRYGLSMPPLLCSLACFSLSSSGGIRLFSRRGRARGPRRALSFGVGGEWGLVAMMAVVERKQPLLAYLKQRLALLFSWILGVSGFLTPGWHMRLKIDATSNGVFRQQPDEP